MRNISLNMVRCIITNCTKVYNKSVQQKCSTKTYLDDVGMRQRARDGRLHDGHPLVVLCPAHCVHGQHNGLDRDGDALPDPAVHLAVLQRRQLGG